MHPHWSSCEELSEKLGNGSLSLEAGLQVFGESMEKHVKAFQFHVAELTRINQELEVKTEKSERIRKELAEKCQDLQQALLYKEEKYDEKCRELDRYKVVCELAAHAANEDGFPSRVESCVKEVRSNKKQNEGIRMTDIGRLNLDQFSRVGQNIPSSTSRARVPISQSLRDITKSASGMEKNTGAARMASYYVGGPTKRLPTTEEVACAASEINERLANNDSIPGSSVKMNFGPVPIDRLVKSVPFSGDDESTRVSISLLSQSNKVISSSRTAVDELRRIRNERTLNRQVASGLSARMTGRRKKVWPY